MCYINSLLINDVSHYLGLIKIYKYIEMRKKCFLLLMIVTFLINCSKPIKNNSIIISPKLKGEIIQLSTFISEINLIPLETTADCLIAEVGKVLISEQKIYVLDRSTSSIFIFDRWGKFLTKIQDVGHGSEEYIHLIDFDVINDEIFLLDYTGKKIIHYDQQYKFIQATSLSFYASQFGIMDKSFIFKCEPMNNSGDPYFILTSKEGEVIKTIDQLSATGKYNWGEVSFFTRNQTDIMISKLYDNSIFQVKNNKINEYIQLDFGLYNVPVNTNFNDINIFSQDFKYTVKNNYWIVGEWLIMDYFFNLKRYYLRFHLASKNVISGKIENDLNDIPFFPKWSFSHGLIGFLNSYEINEFKFDRLCWPELDNVKVSDNPILVTYSIN